MDFQDKVYYCKQFKSKTGHAGFEGNELDLNWNKNIKICIYQIDLKINMADRPALSIVLKDTSIISRRHRSYDITYRYFFDGNCKFITGFCQGKIGKNMENFNRVRLNSLEQLSNRGDSISDIILPNNDQCTMPYQLLEYQIITSLRDNTLKSDYADNM